MGFLTGILPYSKVLGIFSLILPGIRFKLGLASSTLCGAVIMVLVFGLSALPSVSARPGSCCSCCCFDKR